MDLLSMLGILVRRWYVFLLILAVTAAGLAYLYPRLKPDYQATGALFLSPPNSVIQVIQTQPTQIPVNPLLANQTSILGLASTLANAGDSQAEKQLMASQYGLTYTIVVDSHAPLITVQGSAQTQDGAITGVEALLQYLSDQLNQIQQLVGAPPNQLVTSKVLYSPQTAVASNSSRYKTLLILGFVGLLVASSLAFIVDGIVISLRFRRFMRSQGPSRRRAHGGHRPGVPFPALGVRRSTFQRQPGACRSGKLAAALSLRAMVAAIRSPMGRLALVAMGLAAGLATIAVLPVGRRSDRSCSRCCCLPCAVASRCGITAVPHDCHHLRQSRISTDSRRGSASRPAPRWKSIGTAGCCGK